MLITLRNMLVVFVGFILISGCGTEEIESSIAKINSATQALLSDVKSDYSAATLANQQLPTKFSSSLGSSPNATFSDLINQLYTGLQSSVAFPYPEVRTYKVTYTIPGYSSTLTGLVAVPSNPLNPQTLKLPMISLQHPTQVLRSQSPSRVTKYGDEQLTVPYGMMLAAMGYIVVMPDYPGMGDNMDIHPYCMTSLAKSVSGLIVAAGNGNQAWSSRASWDGRLFLIGFSEGGYATLVTARDIQENHPGYNLVGVAALDGPYSLSDTMRNVMLTAGTDFSAPYFLPYVVAAYGSVYGTRSSIMKFDNAVKNDLMPDNSRFSAKLYPMLFGDYNGEQIGSMMKQVPPSNSYAGPKSILTTPYLNDLNSTSSALYKALYENDAFRGWTPQSKTQVLLYHNVNDDLVPFGNFDNTKANWGATLSNVTYHTSTDQIAGLGSIHAGALIPAYIKAMQWVDDLAYPGR